VAYVYLNRFGAVYFSLHFRFTCFLFKMEFKTGSWYPGNCSRVPGS